MSRWRLLACAAAVFAPWVAHAQTVAAPAVTLDLTGIIVAVVGGVFSLLAIVGGYLVQKKVTDQQAATVLAAAVRNSLGALQQATEGVVLALKPGVPMPGVPQSLQSGVQYVLDHAGDEAARFGITPEAIASKITAQIGLTSIAANIAVAQAVGGVAKPAALSAAIRIPPVPTSPLLAPVPTAIAPLKPPAAT